MITSEYVRKAAIVLTALPEQQAAQVLSKLNAKQVESVSIEISRLGRITREEQETTIHEFADENPNASGDNVGGLELAKSPVSKALGRNANTTRENVGQSVQSVPFSFLQDVHPDNLQTFLNDEHPQTIAMILSYLPPSYGSQVIAGLPVDRQLAVIRRIAQMGQTNPDVIEEIEAGLKARMSSMMSQNVARSS